MLEIPQICDYIVNNEGISDPINAIIMKYSKHPSIIKINECIEMSGFMFKCCNISEIQNEISNLKNNTATPSGSVSAPLLKEYKDICGEFLLNIINYGITNSIFDNGMKRADITPFPKEEKSNDKKNFRPISVLPAGSKIFERILHKQISSHIENYLSSYLCGYRKGYCAQYAILTLLEKWRISLDNKGYGGAILRLDLGFTKAFDTINHDLLIAKLNAYGFSHSSQSLLYSYLSNRWQRRKINYTFSLWTEILQGVPQGSILGPLLFNIYLNDLFFLDIESELCNYADDNTLYQCELSLNVLVEKLEKSAKSVIQWFGYNYMKLNESKCKLLISGNKKEIIIASVGNTKLIESHKVKLLGTIIDRELTFNENVNIRCKTAGRKLNALMRLSNIHPFHKRRMLMKSFVESQFAYAPLLNLFHSRELNNKINNLHYRALKSVYRDDFSTFQELLKK